MTLSSQSLQLDNAMDGVCNLRELEARAAAVLPAPVFGYYRSGADDEATLAENEAAFARWQLRPRVLVDVSRLDTSCRLLGHTLATPLLVAPMAAQRMAHARGELATAAAAASLGAGFVLSTLSTTSLEDVAAVRRAGGPPHFFQLYCFRDRAVSAALVRRAERSGFAAVVLTADAPALGRREADVRSGFALPAHLTFANLATERGASADQAATPAQADDGSRLAAYFAEQVDPSLTWDAVRWLRTVTSLPVLVKGVLTGEDAALAVAAGCAGVCVSNHGGRQLDGTAAAVDALPEVVAAVAGRVPVLLDGGVRRGSDVLKALALGATAVMVGRPVLYGLALGGEDGAAQTLAMLHRELRLAMALAGTPALPFGRREMLQRRRGECACQSKL